MSKDAQSYADERNATQRCLIEITMFVTIFLSEIDFSSIGLSI